MTSRDDDDFNDAPAHIREHARKVRAVQDASRAQELEADAARRHQEAEGIRVEPFADGWDDLPQTPSNGPDTRDLRLRIVSQLGEAPTLSAELVTDLHDELSRIETFCAKLRRAFGLPPR